MLPEHPHRQAERVSMLAEGHTDHQILVRRGHAGRSKHGKRAAQKMRRRIFETSP